MNIMTFFFVNQKKAITFAADFKNQVILFHIKNSFSNVCNRNHSWSAIQS
jgi:hypothetical protein